MSCRSSYREDLILSGHDRSDGGLATTLLEMAFAGNCGIEIEMNSQQSAISDQHAEREAIQRLFSEELGMVIEYLPENEDRIVVSLKEKGILFQILGRTTYRAKDQNFAIYY